MSGIASNPLGGSRADSCGSSHGDVILVSYYPDPQLYPLLRAWLRGGGLLFYETYTREQLRFRSGPRNPSHLLEPGELLATFRDLEILYYRETRHQRGIASPVARKPVQ